NFKVENLEKDDNLPNLPICWSPPHNNNDNISNITIRKKQKLPTLPPETTSKLNKDSSANNNASMMDSHVLSDHEILSDTYISPNKLSKTLDGTLSDVISMAEMKDTLSQCKKKLNMTELELDNLILENNSLHKQIEKLTTENNTLKSLCHSSSIIESTPNPKTEENINAAKCSIYSSTIPAGLRTSTDIKPGTKSSKIIAETKPNAVTDEIVKSCKHLQLKPGDKLVLSVGENDDNAKKVLSQLNDVL
ncbi:hypothetical protein HW555_013295, partial [Spodoptera exigua]